MTPPIDRETLETEFRPEELTTFTGAAVASIQHGPTSHFLRTVGIPSRPNPWFEFVDGTSQGTEQLGDSYRDLRDRWTNLPVGAEEWILLGTVPYDDIAVDGTTGVVHCLPGDGPETYRLNKDVVSLVHFLYLLEKERPNYAFESDQSDQSDQGTLDPEGAARRLTERMREIDPAALETSRSRWHDVLDYVAYPEIR